MVAQSILLLNASYEPLTAVSLARAVKLLLKGRAEAVGDEHVIVASAAQTLAVPQVLRLKIYARVPHRRTPVWSRHGVFARDDYTCAYCSRRYPASDLTVDHIIPASQGGTSTWGNTVAACAHCNQRKADRTPHQAGMKLLIEPKTLRTSYLMCSGDVPAAWKVWIEL